MCATVSINAHHYVDCMGETECADSVRQFPKLDSVIHMSGPSVARLLVRQTL